MEVIFEAKQISKSFGYGKFAISPMDLTINSGEIVGIVGENGNGKTTLLRLIAGELGRDQGEVSFFNQNLDSLGWTKYKKSIAYIPQRIPRWWGNLRDNLIFQASLLGYKNEDELVDKLVEQLGLEEYVNLNWSEISTGYRLRFQLAKMLIGDPKLLVLDEPIANLDVNAQEKFLSDLRNVVSDPNRKVGVIFSSQQLNEVENVSDKVIFLRKGALVFGGETEKIGDSREENSFEIQSNVSEALLKELFPNAKIQLFGKTVRIDTDLNTTSNKILEKLLQNNIEIQYFRDISKSTKRMFK